ncbi:MAG: hypothetical protein R3F23_03640 [Verrucomicrobiia bacterium]
MKYSKLALYGLLGFVFQFSLRGQIDISNVPFTYSQNFDVFGINNSPWSNNMTPFPGWYYVYATDGMGSSDIFGLVADDGSNPLVVPKNYGSNGSLDRALGGVNGMLGPQHLDWFYGARFHNSTAFSVSNITISYRGEQWTQNNAMPQTLRFFYRIGGSDFLANNTGWTALSLFDFVSPRTGVTLALDGNALPNRKLFSVNSAVFPNPIVIPANGEFWIRWAQSDNLNNGQGLAIDDFSIDFSTNGFNVNPNPTNNAPVSFSDIQLSLKKPKFDKTLRFKGTSGFSFKTHVLATVRHQLKCLTPLSLQE